MGAQQHGPQRGGQRRDNDIEHGTGSKREQPEREDVEQGTPTGGDEEE